jgi:hypothetical protein
MDAASHEEWPVRRLARVSGWKMIQARREKQ